MMKKSALQLLKAVEHDNQKLITGNVADYLLNDLYNSDYKWFDYLTDKEIEEMHNNPCLTSQYWDELSKIIKENFNYEIKNS